MSGRFSDLIRIQSALLYVLSAAMAIPLVLALAYDEHAALVAFSEVIIGCALLSTAIRIFVRPARSHLKLRDGFFVVALAWLICSLAGCLPFILSGAIPSFADAFFESCSGFSTTGASILTDIEALPQSILFWRSFTHWLGGLGIVLIVIALLPVLGINGQIAAFAETPGPTKDKLTPRFSDTAKGLCKIYLVFTFAEVILLKLGGMSLYDAFIHTFGTVGTGGFSNYNDSVGHFDSTYIQIVIIVFMLLAGTNLNLFYLVKRRGISHLVNDEEVRFYMLVTGTASLLIFAVNVFSKHFSDVAGTLLDSVFQVVSIITTTGYATADYDTWPTFARMVILCLFFFGACSSSTSGGVKCARILICFKLIKRSLSLRIHPNRIAPVTLNDAEIPTDTVIKVTGFILTYIVVIFAGTLLLSINNFDFMTTFSAAATCLGNIGPGFHKIGPVFNFSVFSDFSKYVCSFLMIAGRLELFTVFILFSKYYWNPNKAK